MKNKIKQLFHGTREDCILACNLLVNNFDPKEFLDEWEKEIGPELIKKEYPCRTDPKRAVIILKENTRSLFNNEDYFYYKVSDFFYILCDKGQAVSECYTNYNISMEVINHF